MRRVLLFAGCVAAMVPAGAWSQRGYAAAYDETYEFSGDVVEQLSARFGIQSAVSEEYAYRMALSLLNGPALSSDYTRADLVGNRLLVLIAGGTPTYADMAAAVQDVASDVPKGVPLEALGPVLEVECLWRNQVVRDAFCETVARAVHDRTVVAGSSLRSGTPIPSASDAWALEDLLPPSLTASTCLASGRDGQCRVDGRTYRLEAMTCVQYRDLTLGQARKAILDRCLEKVFVRECASARGLRQAPEYAATIRAAIQATLGFQVAPFALSAFDRLRTLSCEHEVMRAMLVEAMAAEAPKASPAGEDAAYGEALAQWLRSVTPRIQ